jgi:hypothetical protein
MEALAFLIIIATGIAVMLISMMLDHLWAQVLPVRTFYYLVRAPGVIVHECSHILGCILTGARITDVVFFSQEGGSVTYTRPKIPVLGDVIISSAPLFCIPLLLTGLTWCFATFLGCTFPDFPVSISSADTLHDLAISIVALFTLWKITEVVGMGFALGLTFGMIALVVSLPPFIWYLARHRL